MKRVLLFVYCVMPVWLFAQLPALQQAVNELDRNPSMRSASWSLCVRDAQTGEVLLDHNGYKSLATASTMKALTTATALAILGEDFRFETQLAYDGSIDDNGVLRGNLYIIGDGDPTLGSSRIRKEDDLPTILHSWSLALQKRGIKQITGQIIADASVYGTQLTPAKWPWEDIGNYYGAGASGLNVHENYYRLVLRPGPSKGSRTEVLRTIPFQENLLFINEITTGSPSSGDQGYIYGAPYSYVRYLRGTVPGGRSSFTIKGSIADPALYCATQFRNELVSCSIQVEGGATSVRILRNQGRRVNTRRQVLFSHYSAPLVEIVRETNIHSINLYAEALAKRLAVAKGRPGTTEEGMATIEAYWKGLGVDTRGMYLRDGAGLSPNNALSTRQLTAVLYRSYRAAYGTSFRNSLPVSGKSGSLKNMLRGTVAAGRVRAKSGYIGGVRGYAGYATTLSGRELAFTMVANYYEGGAGAMRKRFETLMVKMVQGK